MPTIDLFPETKAAPLPRLKRAHFTDAGDGMPGYPFGAAFTCKCGWRSGWLCFERKSDIARGVPCERCNDMH